jgi:hypothetical protein
MFTAGGLLPYRLSGGERQYLLLEELRYNKRVLHVAGGRVEPVDADIRSTICREFVEEVGAWPSDLRERVNAAPLSCPTSGYCLATVDVSDVADQPPENTHWVSATAKTEVPMSWLAARCVSRCQPLRFGLAAQ